MNKESNKQGFTLIEVILGIAIFALLGLVAINGYQYWRRSR